MVRSDSSFINKDIAKDLFLAPIRGDFLSSSSGLLFSSFFFKALCLGPAIVEDRKIYGQTRAKGVRLAPSFYNLIDPQVLLRLQLDALWSLFGLAQDLVFLHVRMKEK